MANTLGVFYGQHEDERILCVVRQHPIALSSRVIQIALAALVILIGFSFIGSQFGTIGGILVGLGWLLAILIGGGGTLMVLTGERKNVAYITDRRVIRFQTVTPWVVNSRSLTWEEAVKVKTYSPNLILRILNIGTVVVHAKTTVITSDEPKTKTAVSDDDVTLTDVAYFKDLGNYIDKILYLYRQKPEELKTMRQFVAKPKGMRSGSTIEETEVVAKPSQEVVQNQPINEPVKPEVKPRQIRGEIKLGE